MSYKPLFVVLMAALASICSAKHVQVEEKIKLDLYYECLCPACIYFHTKMLPPLVKKLGPWINLHTYPFGNAQFLDETHTKVRCQHGERECYGNKLLACSIKQLRHMDKYVEYDACVIAKRSTDEAADECGKKLNVDSNRIKACAKGPEGDRLLRWFGEETLKVRPGQNYTPYFLIKGVPFTGDDLLKAVCAAFTNPPQPCHQKSYSVCQEERLKKLATAGKLSDSLQTLKTFEYNLLGCCHRGWLTTEL